MPYKNRSARITNATYHRARKERIFRTLIWEYKRSHPCVDCGEADPIVLQFDHREPKSKNFSIGSGCASSESLLLSEILKCDVVCANCHARRTAKQRRYHLNFAGKDEVYKTRKCTRLTFRGETRGLVAWAKELGIPYTTIQGRLNRGWHIDRVLGTASLSVGRGGNHDAITA